MPGPSTFASASCRKASGTSRPGSGLPPSPQPLPHTEFCGPPLALWDPPPPPIAWRSFKPMPWRVPPVGGSYRGSASKSHRHAPPTPPPPPLKPQTPSTTWTLPPLLLQKPSFLLSCPKDGPAAEAARANVYNFGSRLRCCAPLPYILHLWGILQSWMARMRFGARSLRPRLRKHGQGSVTKPSSSSSSSCFCARSALDLPSTAAYSSVHAAASSSSSPGSSGCWIPRLRLLFLAQLHYYGQPQKKSHADTMVSLLGWGLPITFRHFMHNVYTQRGPPTVSMFNH